MPKIPKGTGLEKLLTKNKPFFFNFSLTFYYSSFGHPKGRYLVVRFSEIGWHSELFVTS